jgi:hypothetical protein
LLKRLSDTTQPGDLVLTLGAGNVWQVGERFLEIRAATGRERLVTASDPLAAARGSD